MEKKMMDTCPYCGKKLEITGKEKAGKCPIHRMYFPLSADAQQEADRLTRELKKEKELAHRRIAKQREEKVRKIESRRRGAVLGRVAAVVAVLAVAGAAAAWFLLVPRLNYNSAEALLNQGDYQAAYEKFAGLGDYENSDGKAALCDALISLQSNDLAAAMDRLDVLGDSGDPELAAVLRDAIVPAVKQWKNNGITPEALLMLLERSDALGLSGDLDTAQLFRDAHVEMAKAEDVLDVLAVDVNADGTEELAVLKDNFALIIYEMKAGGNAKITYDAQTGAACLRTFGGRYEGRDEEKALACYQAAYNMHPGTESVASLARMLQARATGYETDENYESALADAAAAFDVLGGREALDFYYQMTLRGCQAQQTQPEAIRMWDEFIARNAATLSQYGLGGASAEVAAQQRLEYARELAAEQDIACARWLEEAWECGADVEQTLLFAVNQFPVGYERMELRRLGMTLYEQDSVKYNEQKRMLGEEMCSTLRNWQSLGLEVQEVFGLLAQAEDMTLDLGDLDAQKIYQEAALATAAADGLLTYQFVDFDGDGAQELLGVDAAGDLLYYGQIGSGKGAERLSGGLPGASAVIIAGRTPEVLLETADSFVVYAWREGALVPMLSVSGAVNYQRDGSVITYGEALPGSVARTRDYRYELGTAADSAVLTGVSWPKDNYPMPQSAAECVTRYFEAVGYGLDEEAALLLSAESDSGMDFELDYLTGLTGPDMPLSLSVEPYYEDGGLCMCQAAYAAGGETVTAFICAEEKDGWVLTGAGNSYFGVSDEAALHLSDADMSLPMLELNAPQQGKLADADDVHVYRVVLPTASRVEVGWRTEGAKDRKGMFNVSLHMGNADADAFIIYGMGAAENEVFAPALYLPAGVHYVRVAAGTFMDCSYALRVNAQFSPFGETEDNDVPERADAVETDRTYSAVLHNVKDADCFAFTLEQPGEVYLLLETTGPEGSDPAFCMELMPREGQEALMSVMVADGMAQGRTGSVFLAEGEYLLRVKAEEAASTSEYRFTVCYTANDAVERESNDTPDTASAIAVNRVYTGQADKSKDVDWYAFDLEQSGIVRLQMAFEPNKSGNDQFVMELASDAHALWSGTMIGTSGGVQSPALALPAGSYRIKVSSLRTYSGKYQLQALFEGANVELEPNDTAPMRLEANSEICGSLLAVSAGQTGSDTDNFRISLSEPGRLRLQFSYDAPGTTGSYFTLAVANSKAMSSALHYDSISGKESTVTSPSLYLDAGEYIVQIKQDNKLWTGAYTLKTEFEAVGNAERELNNSLEQATELPLNALYTGSFGTSGDVDFYRFTLPAAGMVQPRLNFHPLNTTQEVYTLALTDGTNELAHYKFKGEQSSQTLAGIILPAGDYYLRLENPAYCSQDYSVGIAFEEVAGAESEPNDTPSVATDLPVNGCLTGMLLTKEDEDVYRLVFTEMTDVRLTFRCQSGANGFSLTIEQNGKTAKKLPDPDGNGISQSEVRFGAGEFYLRVKAKTDQWSRSLYTLEITAQ